MKERVLVAMSGGVDSSVAAYLLKEEGYEIIGATIKTWSSGECRDERAKGCCSLRDVDDARSVAAKLGIPYYVLDLSEEFKEKVIDNFVETYLEAKTPHPCIRCNNDIKFGAFLKKAEELGAARVATGHYARKVRDKESGRWTIAEAGDPTKDQSYVLFGLTAAQIEKTLLPVGDYPKTEIRAIARKLGLRVSDKPDSQEICFVSSHYAEFITRQGVALPGRGPILDREGRLVGEHEGYHLFTIGQRKGMGLTHPTPYYVIAVDRARNAVIVGEESDLYKKAISVKNTNWILPPRAGKTYAAKIRSRHAKAPGTLKDFSSEGDARFEFEVPEKSPAPGQAAVFYDGDKIAGGGWIEEAFAGAPSPAHSASL